MGGGVIVIPALTLLFGIDIRYAAGASLVSVIATSSGAAAAYVRERMTNLRVAMFLELGTTVGAVTGAYLAGILHNHWLFVIFGVVLLWSAWANLARRRARTDPVPPDRLADRLRLHGAFYDEALGQERGYRVTHTRLGLLLMYVAGLVSGLLGVGSGLLKVTAMDAAMRMPIKASSATSNLMIGVTAAASAGVYFVRGDIDPFIAAPVALGVLVGSTVGARALARSDSRIVRWVLSCVLAVIGLEMVWRHLR
jgi:uncharacterized membrane protein YfcA